MPLATGADLFVFINIREEASCLGCYFLRK